MGRAEPRRDISNAPKRHPRRGHAARACPVLPKAADHGSHGGEAEIGDGISPGRGRYVPMEGHSQRLGEDCPRIERARHGHEDRSRSGDHPSVAAGRARAASRYARFVG
jgi:hypothetical protein